MKKYEQEIRELLEKMDKESFVGENGTATERERENRRKTSGAVQPPPRPIRLKTNKPSKFRQWVNDNSALALMLLGYTFVIAGLVLRGEVFKDISSPLFWLVQLLIAIGACMYIAPIFYHFFTGRGVKRDPRVWRGENVNDTPTFSWEKVKGWLGSNKNNKRGGGSGNGGRDPWNNRRNDKWQ